MKKVIAQKRALIITALVLCELVFLGSFITPVFGQYDSSPTATPQGTREGAGFSVVPDLDDDPILPNIVGGEEVSPKYAYPWQVQIGIQVGVGDYSYCGGSLLSHDWVITAAHCVFDVDKSKVSIWAGKHYLPTQNEDSQQYSKAERIIIHPQYDSIQDMNDIALIKLASPFVYTDEVHRIALAKPTSGHFTNRTATVTGWGLTGDGYNLSSVLKELSTTVIANSVCDNYWSVQSNQICTLTVGEQAYYGDSGGPLFLWEDGEPILVGVVSYWSGTVSENAPVVYSRISSFYDWIISNDIYSFNGSVEIHADQNVVSIGRPHIQKEIMAYNGVNQGATTIFLPMLFNGMWNYESGFSVQNTSNDAAVYSITFKSGHDGTTTCVLEGQNLPGHTAKTYDLTTIGNCNGGGVMERGWFGGATILSDKPLAAVAKPVVDGVDVVTYNGFTAGSEKVYLPMLFRGIWGYQSAFYVQNMDNSKAIEIEIQFYDTNGQETCTFTDPTPLGPNVTRGYWLAGMNDETQCIGGTGFPDDGWVGAAIIKRVTGTGEIVAIARPHMGAEVAAYNGFAEGNTINYLPMLFRGMWGYVGAIYLQNISEASSSIEITFYDASGNEVCKYSDPQNLASKSTRGYWLPTLNCNDGRNFPSEGWVGSAKIDTSQEVIALGRPHLSDGQVVVYNAFTRGAADTYLPMNFFSRSGLGTAVYIQNITDRTATAQIMLYDEESGFYCQFLREINPGNSTAIWLGGLVENECDP